MAVRLAGPEILARLCGELTVTDGIDTLTQRINARMPGLTFEWVLTRGSWHRLGGVVDAAHRPVSGNILQWAEQESENGMEALLARYAGAGYFATRLSGKTHYFTASWGEAPEAFVQLEIEELQEVIERPLVEREWYPETLEEFLNPLDYTRPEPEPVGSSYWQFRRIIPIDRLLSEAPRENQALASLRRFFRDWAGSSAQDGGPFCHHWVLALREYIDSDGECRLSAKPISTFGGRFSPLPEGARLQGAQLANAIHGYDRRVGYPFAWFFNMVCRHAENYTLAQAVLRDQMGAYDYLPARDLKVLRQWEARPYGV